MGLCQGMAGFGLPPPRAGDRVRPPLPPVAAQRASGRRRNEADETTTRVWPCQVGRTPSSARDPPDAPWRARVNHLWADEGVGRGPGGPPYLKKRSQSSPPPAGAALGIAGLYQISLVMPEAPVEGGLTITAGGIQSNAVAVKVQP